MFGKKGVIIVSQVGILYGLYRFGVFLQQRFDLFIPGSIIGMVILFILLICNSRLSRFVEKGADLFLEHLPLFFIPATVGVVDYFPLFHGKGIWLLVIAIVSTLIVMLTSSFTSRLLAKEKGRLKG